MIYASYYAPLLWIIDVLNENTYDQLEGEISAPYFCSKFPDFQNFLPVTIISLAEII